MLKKYSVLHLLANENLLLERLSRNKRRYLAFIRRAMGKLEKMSANMWDTVALRLSIITCYLSIR